MPDQTRSAGWDLLTLEIAGRGLFCYSFAPNLFAASGMLVLNIFVRVPPFRDFRFHFPLFLLPHLRICVKRIALTKYEAVLRGRREQKAKKTRLKSGARGNPRVPRVYNPNRDRMFTKPKSENPMTPNPRNP